MKSSNKDHAFHKSVEKRVENDRLEAFKSRKNLAFLRFAYSLCSSYFSITYGDQPATARVWPG